jgi:hypothetical protein
MYMDESQCTKPANEEDKKKEKKKQESISIIEPDIYMQMSSPQKKKRKSLFLRYAPP